MNSKEGVAVSGLDKSKLANDTYGYCPRCGCAGQTRERRPDGDDRCVLGHKYPSASAVPWAVVNGLLMLHNRGVADGAIGTRRAAHDALMALRSEPGDHGPCEFCPSKPAPENVVKLKAFLHEAATLSHVPVEAPEGGLVGGAASRGALMMEIQDLRESLAICNEDFEKIKRINTRYDEIFTATCKENCELEKRVSELETDCKAMAIQVDRNRNIPSSPGR